MTSFPRRQRRFAPPISSRVDRWRCARNDHRDGSGSPGTLQAPRRGLRKTHGKYETVGAPEQCSNREEALVASATSRHQPRSSSSGAARRAARRRRSQRSLPVGWLAAVAVVVVVVGLIVWRVTESSGGSSSAGQASGIHPVLASTSIVHPVISVPTSVYDRVGITGEPTNFQRTSVTAPVTVAGKAQFTYFGAEYCPYCALMRWSLVAALSRFGTGYHASSEGDRYLRGFGWRTFSTFSFPGSKYTSKYVSFQLPSEVEDRNRNPLQTPSAAMQASVSKYDAPPFTTVKPMRAVSRFWMPAIPSSPTAIRRR